MNLKTAFWPGAVEARAMVRDTDGRERPARLSDARTAAVRALSDADLSRWLVSVRVDVDRGCVVQIAIPQFTDNAWNDSETILAFAAAVMRGESPEVPRRGCV